MNFKHLFLVLTTCLIFISQNANTQSIELFTGANYNYNVPINIKSTGIHRQESSNSLKLNFGIALDSVKINFRTYRFSLLWLSQTGTIISTTNKPLSQSHETNNYSRSNLIASVYFINFRKQKLQLNAGLYLSILTKQKFTAVGEIISNNQGNIEYTQTYSTENHYHIFPWLNLGLTGRIAYDLKIYKNIFITPQYTFAVGFFPDPYSIPIRQFANIGLKYKFPPKKTALKRVQKK